MLTFLISWKLTVDNLDWKFNKSNSEIKNNSYLNLPTFCTPIVDSSKRITENNNTFISMNSTIQILTYMWHKVFLFSIIRSNGTTNNWCAKRWHIFK